MEVGAGEFLLLPRDVSNVAPRFHRALHGGGCHAIKYLAHWRLRLAKEKLVDGRQAIAQIAHAIGYDSEVAITRSRVSVIRPFVGVIDRIRNDATSIYCFIFLMLYISNDQAAQDGHYPSEVMS